MNDGPTNDRNGLLKGDQISVGGSSVSVPPGQLPHRRKAKPVTGPGDPKIDVVRDDNGAIKQITVRCTCGREISLQCEYLSEGG